MTDDTTIRRPVRLRSWAALPIGILLASCLSAPAAPNYTFIEPVAPTHTGAPASARGEEATVSSATRLVGVQAGDGARVSLSWRDGRGQVWQDERVRWTTEPADHVRRVIQAGLAQAHAASGGEQRLSIDLLTFGVLATQDGLGAQVRLFAVVEGRDGSVHLAREYAATRPVTGDASARRIDHAELCVALGEATDEVVRAMLADLQADATRAR